MSGLTEERLCHRRWTAVGLVGREVVPEEHRMHNSVSYASGVLMDDFIGVLSLLSVHYNYKPAL